MKPFLFRAEAALVLRRRQDEEARRQLALSNGQARAAEADLQAALAALDEAMDRARAAAAAGSHAMLVEWHRNWIKARQLQAAKRRQALAERVAAVKIAQEQAWQARRQLRALEHLRERAWRAYQRAVQRAEQKELDQLGATRYAARMAAREEGN